MLKSSCMVSAELLDYASPIEDPPADLLKPTKCDKPSDDTSMYIKLLSTSSTALHKNFCSLLDATSSSVRVSFGGSIRRYFIGSATFSNRAKLTVGPRGHQRYDAIHGSFLSSLEPAKGKVPDFTFQRFA